MVEARPDAVGAGIGPTVAIHPPEGRPVRPGGLLLVLGAASMPSLMALTTVGSSRVVTSPRSRCSATSRSSRRMILPLRVLGSSGVSMIWRGLAIGPISCATWSRSSATKASPPGASSNPVPFTVTKATMAWPVVASLAPTTAASATAGWLDQGVLDLGGGDPVTGDVHHVVDPTEQPEVAVLVPLGPVAGEVRPGNRDQ